MIQQEIGKMPVLAFGNSTGDFSMATYTIQNKKYSGRAYMLLCDDTVRDYGDLEVAQAFREKCDANGFYTVRDVFERADKKMYDRKKQLKAMGAATRL